jgi:hypothetical protein
MVSTIIRCPSCKKANKLGSRYCIECGTILKTIYCSICGSANPDGLEQCLECGKTLPSLSGIKWGPIVTVLKPTSAMTDEEELLSERNEKTDDGYDESKN